jgi:hypothetical protein
MKYTFLKQLWVALKIWVIALSVNTIVGSIFLAGGLDRDIMFFGLLYGSIFSFPIFCILLIVISHCVSRRKNGLLLFRYVFITGLILTLFSFAIFSWWIHLVVPHALGIVPLLAAIAGVSSQYGALFRLSDYDKKLEKFLL